MISEPQKQTTTSLRVSADEAFNLLFERNAWIWIKTPILLFLAWKFFLPMAWKLGLLLFISVTCTYISPCPVGPSVIAFHLWFMLFSHGVMIYVVFWYVAFVFAYLQHPGSASKALGAVGILLSPIALICAALTIGLIGEWLGVPQEEFWAFLDRWTPLASWRVQE